MNTQSDNSKTESPSTTSAAGAATDAGDGKRSICSRDGEGCGRGGRRCGRKVLFVLGIVLVAGLAGSFIGKSFAHGGPAFFGMHGTSFSSDPARMEEGIDRMVRRFAGRTEATPEQQQKLSVIAKAAARDIMPVREQLQKARTQAVELLKAPAVDRAAIERLRSEQLQLADTVSQRITRAMGDAAEVLTPEQRQKIAGRMTEWMERSGRGDHRWFGSGSQSPATPVAPPAGAKSA